MQNGHAVFQKDNAVYNVINGQFTKANLSDRIARIDPLHNLLGFLLTELIC